MVSPRSGTGDNEGWRPGVIGQPLPPRVGTQMSQEDAAASFRKLEMLQEERGADRNGRKGTGEAGGEGTALCCTQHNTS